MLETLSSLNSFNKKDPERNAFMLNGQLGYMGYDWWWHSFTAQDAVTGEDKAFFMYWHAEGMKSAYSGTIEFNGRKYTVTPEKSYGYADKNWGRDFTSPWVWLSSNCLVSKKNGERLGF